MEDFDGIWKFATYSNFSVAGEDDKYRLTVGGYSGDAGKKLIIHLLGSYIINNYSLHEKSCFR